MSVWVEIYNFVKFCFVSVSRSTWACELKWKRCWYGQADFGHAPRERVSWNFQFVLYCLSILVTLHVSVWVEIASLKDLSIWVKSRSTWACELKWCISTFYKFRLMSRSTWACELKYNILVLFLLIPCHAPRERVSWNSKRIVATLQLFCHAPRERVSWNTREQTAVDIIVHVTLHVSVWVEIVWRCLFVLSLRMSRSTWACELKLLNFPTQRW